MICAIRNEEPRGGAAGIDRLPHQEEPLAIVAMVMVMFVVMVVAMVVVIVTFSFAMVAVILVLAVVVAVIVAIFVVEFVSAEVLFPALMPSPIGMFTVLRERAAISEARIVVVVDVATESDRPVKPGSRPDEYPAHKPLRAVVAKRRALIGRVIEVAIRTNRCDTNVYSDLRGGIF